MGVAGENRRFLWITGRKSLIFGIALFDFGRPVVLRASGAPLSLK
jgi:hypothetical protein